MQEKSEKVFFLFSGGLLYASLIFYTYFNQSQDSIALSM
jgi:hypothetical protein